MIQNYKSNRLQRRTLREPEKADVQVSTLERESVNKVQHKPIKYGYKSQQYSRTNQNYEDKPKKGKLIKFRKCGGQYPLIFKNTTLNAKHVNVARE